MLSKTNPKEFNLGEERCQNNGQPSQKDYDVSWLRKSDTEICKSQGEQHGQQNEKKDEAIRPRDGERTST